MIFHICPQNDFLTAIYFQPMTEQFRVFHRNASTCNHLCSTLKSNFQIFITLYSTTKIDNERSVRSNPFQHPIIDYMMRSSTVQVYYMKPANTVRFKLLGNFHRIFVIYFLTVVISLGKTYALSVNNINGWNNFYHLLFIC